MPGRIPHAVVDEVSRRTDILDVVGAYVDLSQKGERWWGLCPFHNEKTPSFSVSRDTNLFYCFGCRQGGGVYRFVMEMEGLSFPESVRKLAEKVGVDVPNLDENPDYRNNRRVLEDLYTKVSTTFRWLLLNHPEASAAREYLRSRGIDDETAEKYRIGWAPSDGEWLYDFLVEKKYSPEFLGESGLFSSRSPCWAFFVDRLMFPVMPDTERVVAFSGRSLEEKGPKYKNSPDTVIYKKSRELYGLGQAKRGIRNEKRVIVCEGNIDVLACAQAGLDATVAPLGTAFTPEQAGILKRSAERIVLAFDGDSAGRNATMKAAVTAENAGLRVQAATIPPGRDPADILEKNGADSLKKILSESINIFSYLLNFLIGTRTGISGEAQEEAIKELTPYLNAVGSEVRREAYLRHLAENINANPQTVMREYERGFRSLRTVNEVPRPVHQSTREDAPLIGDDLYLMIAVAVRTEYFSILRTMLPPETLRDRRALSVYRVMDDLSLGGGVPRTDSIVANLDDELASLIIEKASTELFDDKAEETIRENIRRIRIRSLTEESRELIKVLAKDSTSDPERTLARMERIKKIDQEIMKIRQGEDGGDQV